MSLSTPARRPSFPHAPSPRRAAILFAISLLIVAVPDVGGSARPPDAPAKDGYFKVAKRGEGWAFIDPRGRDFFSLGINVINPAEDAAVAPPKYDGLARHGGSREKWRAFTLGRLDAWNFNTIGAWSALRGRPYVLELSLSYSWIDVFGDDFETYVRRAALESRKRPDVAADYPALAADRQLIGYFTDNELDWGWGYAWTGAPGDLSLFEYYAGLGADDPGKKAWAAHLAAAHGGNFNDLRRVWDTDAGSEAALLAVKSIAPCGKDRWAEAGRVADGFLRTVAERYFAVTGGVMRKHLPNHLNLGTRLTPRFPTVVAEVAGRHVDVLSFNVYSRDLEFVKSEVTRLHRAGGRPVLVTEFAFPARRNLSGNASKGYEQVEVPDDAARGREYARFVGAVGEIPAVVGCHWFQYHDEPTCGRNDGESVNFGFVDLADAVYDDLARQAAGANAQLLRKRMPATAPSPPAVCPGPIRSSGITVVIDGSSVRPPLHTDRLYPAQRSRPGHGIVPRLRR